MRDNNKAAARDLLFLAAPENHIMARVDFEDFAEKEVARIYIAGRLTEAESVEKTLTSNGIDYAVEVEPFRTYMFRMFPTLYGGAAFYVVSGQDQLSRRVLLDAALDVGIVDESDA